MLTKSKESLDGGKLRRRDGVPGFLRRSDWGAAGLLIASAALPYANTLSNNFVYDDNSQLLDNPYIRSFHFLPQIFGSNVWSFTGGLSRYYRPMMTLGYLFCYKIFGFSAAGFHMVNLGLHAAVVCLLFFVTTRLFGDRVLAFGAAALFALHPIHTESVAWIAAITDLELTFFFLLTFWFFLALSSLRGRRLAVAYVAMVCSFALALLSKEQATTLPFLATVYEHFYREDRDQTLWQEKFRRYLPLWLLTAIYMPVRVFAVGGFVVTSNYWGLTWRELISSALALTGQYLWKLLWPAQLCAFYVFEKPAKILDPGVLAGGVSGLLLIAAFWWLWKRAQMLSFGLLWFAVTLLPVLNPKWLGTNVFTERYLYLPSVGFCWVVAWILTISWTAVSRRKIVWRGAFVMALSALALLCTFRIIMRNRDWQDDITLYTRTLEVSPDASLIRSNLAGIYKARGFFKEAEKEYREAVARDPDCPDCLEEFATLFMEEARYADAAPLLKRALQLEPGLVSATVGLGVVYQNTGMTESAKEQFLRAARLATGNSGVHVTLGSFYADQGDYRRAEAAFQRALSINPYSTPARIGLGKLYEKDHRSREAIREFEAVLRNDPADFEAITALRRLGAYGKSKAVSRSNP